MTQRIFLCLVALATVAWASPPADRDGGSDPDRGLYIFQAYCVACHGENGQGDGPMAAKLYRDFGVQPTDLSKPGFHKSRTDKELAQAVRQGGVAVHKTPFMPAWGTTLTDRQVGDLVAYIRELQSDPMDPRPPLVSLGETIDLGRTLYSIHCMACHGVRGLGNGPFLEGMKQAGSALKSPPRFDNYEFFYDKSDQWLEGVVKLGLTHSGLKGDSTQWWHRPLAPQEMRALILFLRTLPMLPSKEKQKV